MPPRPFVNDKLWRCLCPRFSSDVEAARAPGTRRLAPRRAPTQTPRPHTARPHTLHPHIQTRSFFAAAQPSPVQHTPPAPTRPQNPRDAPEKPSLVHLTTATLYEDLWHAGAKGRVDEVLRISNVLMQDRGQAPDAAMYAALLHSFTSSTEGTAGKVRKVLEEMGFWSDEGRVELDIRCCENVLQALAVHPDYLLREEVLQYMRDKWFPLSERAQGFVVAGLMREKLFEQGLDMLEDMCAKKMRVEAWVWSEAMWLLLEYKEVEEAFDVLALMESVAEEGAAGAAYGVKLSNALWGALLDAAAHQHLHDAARIVWTSQVQPGYLQPPTGTCLDVLSLASRHGNVNLATDVFRVLTSRDTVFTTHHYELLIATYLHANALPDALSVILIMSDAGLKFDPATCHPLYTYLRTAPPSPTDAQSRPLHAFTLLQTLESQGRTIPTAVANCCMSAAIALGSLPEALDMYKALHTVCAAGPNTETFNLLFKGCALAARKDLAMLLAREMISLGLKPGRITYDRLILVCERAAQADDSIDANASAADAANTPPNSDPATLDDAVNYFEEMRSAGFHPRRGTYERLLNALLERRDARCVAVLREYRKSGEVLSRIATRIGEQFDVGLEET